MNNVKHKAVYLLPDTKVYRRTLYFSGLAKTISVMGKETRIGIIALYEGSDRSVDLHSKECVESFVQALHQLIDRPASTAYFKRYLLRVTQPTYSAYPVLQITGSQSGVINIRPEHGDTIDCLSKTISNLAEWLTATSASLQDWVNGSEVCEIKSVTEYRHKGGYIAFPNLKKPTTIQSYYITLPGRALPRVRVCLFWGSEQKLMLNYTPQNEKGNKEIVTLMRTLKESFSSDNIIEMCAQSIKVAVGENTTIYYRKEDDLNVVTVTSEIEPLSPGRSHITFTDSEFPEISEVILRACEVFEKNKASADAKK